MPTPPLFCGCFSLEFGMFALKPASFGIHSMSITNENRYVHVLKIAREQMNEPSHKGEIYIQYLNQSIAHRSNKFSIVIIYIEHSRTLTHLLNVQ